MTATMSITMMTKNEYLQCIHIRNQWFIHRKSTVFWRNSSQTTTKTSTTLASSMDIDSDEEETTTLQTEFAEIINKYDSKFVLNPERPRFEICFCFWFERWHNNNTLPTTTTIEQLRKCLMQSFFFLLSSNSHAHVHFSILSRSKLQSISI